MIKIVGLFFFLPLSNSNVAYFGIWKVTNFYFKKISLPSLSLIFSFVSLKWISPISTIFVQSQNLQLWQFYLAVWYHHWILCHFGLWEMGPKRFYSNVRFSWSCFKLNNAHHCWVWATKLNLDSWEGSKQMHRWVWEFSLLCSDIPSCFSVLTMHLELLMLWNAVVWWMDGASSQEGQMWSQIGIWITLFQFFVKYQLRCLINRAQDTLA